MSNYSKTTDFEAKDSLPTGDSGKIIRGAEFETEFDAISTAIATKADTAGPTFTGTLTFETISDGTIGVTAFVDEDNMASNSATLVPTQQSVKAYVDSQVTAQDLDFQADTGGALSIDLDSETMTFTGGTGIDTSGLGNAVTFAIDSTVATLTGTQTLTNKTLTSPDVNTPDIDGGTIDGTVIGGTTPAAVSATTVSATGNITVGGTVDGRDVATDGTKLDGIEAGATADQTAAEIRTLVEAATDSNVFTDADHSKLDGIEAGATGDQTNAEIRAAVEAATDSNVFTDADHSKLDGIEALADVTDTTNVTAAGALMDSELTNITAVKALDQGVATTDTPTFAGLATSANVTFGDNDKAIFGAGSDLQIYHTGSHSFVQDTGSGDLYLATNGDKIILRNTTLGESFFEGTSNGDAKIFYNGLEKLATTSTGIDVTGTIVGDGLTVDGNATIGQTSASDRTLSIGSAGATHFDVTTAGATGIVTLNATNDSTAGKINLQTADTDRLLISNNGDISFYEDTGTTAKLFWDASAESLGIGTSSIATGTKLQVAGETRIYPDSGAGILRFGSGGVEKGKLSVDASSNMAFETAGAERMRIDSNGNLLVGKTVSSLGTEGVTLGPNGQHYFTSEDETALKLNRLTTEGEIIQLRKDGFTVGSIGTAGSRVYISGPSTSLHSGLIFTDNGSEGIIAPSTRAGAIANGTTDLGYSGGRFKDLYLSGGLRGDTTFKNNAGTTEYARFNSSGNLLVGGTDTFPGDGDTNTGISLTASGSAAFSRDGFRVVSVNRNTSDGTLIEFNKNGSEIGSIGVDNSDNLYITGNSSHAGLMCGSTEILPYKGTTLNDGANDIGASSFRWKDLYLSGGITSGANGGLIKEIGGDISVVQGAVGLRINEDASALSPTTASLNNDAAVDLGVSNIRFKDLHLSTNIHQGATVPSSSAAGVISEAVGRATYSRGSGTGGFAHLSFINGNGTVGSVVTSGSATAYNTSSDYRLKENVVTLTGATARLNQLAPKRFNFIGDTEITVDGFLAHEVADVVPEAITGAKDAVDDEGNAVYQGIDQSKLVPLLVATIQELEARIAALESN